MTFRKYNAAKNSRGFFVHSNEAEPAVEILEKLVDDGVPDPEVFNSLCIAHRRRVSTLMLFCLERAIELRPDYAEAINNRGTVLQYRDLRRRFIVTIRRLL